MSLDQRLARAVRQVADGVVVPAVDLDAVRARARSNRRRTAALVTVAAVVAVVVAGTTVVTGRDASSPIPPTGPISPSISESPSTRPLSTSDPGRPSRRPGTTSPSDIRLTGPRSRRPGTGPGSPTSGIT